MPDESPRRDQLLEEASTWFARMRGPDAEAHRPDFERWLELGAAHLGAYNRAGEIFALGKFLSAETPTARDPGEGREFGRIVGWRPIALAAALICTVGAGAWLSQDRIPLTWPTHAAETSSIGSDTRSFLTARNERRRIRLPDGSQVTLQAASAMSMRFDGRRRELRLTQGSARFEVAHEARPFVVLAGGGSVTARGTIFEVAITRDSGVTVRLLRGAVDVRRPTAVGVVLSPVAVTRLAVGETLSFGGGRLTSLESAPFPTASNPASQPREGTMARDFDQVALSAVVAEANQHGPVPIRLSDPSIGALKVSGRFSVNDTGRLADRLSALFDLKVDRSDPSRIELRPR